MIEIYIRSICAECGEELRVLVTLENFDSKFNDTKTTCHNCNSELLITDTFYGDEECNLMKREE